MKVPYRWLAEYVEIEVSKDAVEHLAERLTLAGLEVEELHETGTLTRAFVGRVTSCRPHPDSDHLSLCSVDIGSETIDLICGASNVAEGILVPVILSGGELPSGFRIERRKIRGVESNGMICSKAELGLEERSDGIWVLDPRLGLDVGTDLSTVLEFDDYIYDFKVASNRPDCASIYGVAREVAAILDRPLRPLDTGVDAAKVEPGEPIGVQIEDPDDTPRYAAQRLDGVRIGPAPLRIQHRLIKAGMRPLSNAVDATNYVMLELGHPLHPFDADLLHGPIAIRRAKDGDTFRTLDGTDRHLSTHSLMICDDRGGIALAGVMGGERSEIRNETERVLLEIATFSGSAIRASSRSVGLRSEASQRFERNLDPEGVTLAAQRAVHVLQELTGCQVVGDLADAYPKPSTRRKIRLRSERASGVLGIDVSCEDTAALLGRLGIETSIDGNEVVAEIPAFRTDLEREIDLVEEVGRIYGYDRLVSAPPKALLRVGRKDRTERCKDRIRDALVGLGLSEVITDGFDERHWREVLEQSGDDLISIRNPMTAGQAALRSSLLPGLMTVVETNLNRGVDGGMMFEIGHIFSSVHGERDSLAGILFGRSPLPLHGKEKVTLSEGKGVVEQLLAAVRLVNASIDSNDLPPHVHPGRSGRVLIQGEPLGTFGELAPPAAGALSNPTTVVVFEFDVAGLTARVEEPIAYTPAPRLPASKRDLSVVAPAALREAVIRSAIREDATVESVFLYDVYDGEQVSEGRRSLTYELTLRAEDRTLTDAEIAGLIAGIEQRLGLLNVHLRAQ